MFATLTINRAKSLELMHRLVDQTDEETQLTLEGSLSWFDAHDLTGVTYSKSKSFVLSIPDQSPYGRITIPLTAVNIPRIKRDILPQIDANLLIWHLFLDKGDHKLLAAYDHFSTVLVGDWLSADFIEQLQREQLIDKFERLDSEKD